MHYFGSTNRVWQECDCNNCSTNSSVWLYAATKDLQTQYSHDYKFLKVAKGKSNFQCRVKEDFIDAGKYLCAL